MVCAWRGAALRPLKAVLRPQRALGCVPEARLHCPTLVKSVNALSGTTFQLFVSSQRPSTTLHSYLCACGSSLATSSFSLLFYHLYSAPWIMTRLHQHLFLAYCSIHCILDFTYKVLLFIFNGRLFFLF